MNALKIAGEPLPDMPWEERPAGSKEVLWRYTQNPIIGRDALSTSNSIFNSAVVPFKKGRYNYAGVFRCDDTNRRMRLHVGFSADGLRWDIDEADFRLTGADPEIGEWVYGYDPRVAKIGDKYYVTWCNGYHGPTIGIAWTDDFETFHQLENAFIPFNRNGVLFPRKIGGKFAMLSRPSDNGHTAFGDIFYSESPVSIFTPFLSFTSWVRSNSVFFAHSLRYALIASILEMRSAYLSISGCSGAITMKVTPNRVSGLVV